MQLLDQGILSTPRCANVAEKSFDDLLFFYCLSLEMIMDFFLENIETVRKIIGFRV